jgi:hypothetical protein
MLEYLGVPTTLVSDEMGRAPSLPFKCPGVRKPARRANVRAQMKGVDPHSGLRAPQD